MMSIADSEVGLPDSGGRVSLYQPQLLDAIQDLEFSVHRTSQPYQNIPNAHGKRHCYFRSIRIEYSAMWLLQHGEFRKWLKDAREEIFWCHGPPGTGKSILA